MMKVDVLALGMLTCIRKCFDLIADHKGERWELATVPQDDEAGLRHAVPRANRSACSRSRAARR